MKYDYFNTNDDFLLLFIRCEEFKEIVLIKMMKIFFGYKKYSQL